MPSYPHIEQYHADLERFIEFGGSDNEQSIRRAFAVCLDSYCRDHREKLALVDELKSSKKRQIAEVNAALVLLGQRFGSFL